MPKSGGGYCNNLISLVFIPSNFKDKLKNVKEKYKNLKYKREISYILLGLFVISLFRIISATHAFYNYEMEPVPIFTSKVGNFAKQESKPVLDMLKETGGDTFAGGGDHTTAVAGLYRYKGTYEEVTNNYICLGDENPNVCKTNPDNMYRIIGVTDGTEASTLGLEKGMLKVIKATPSNTSQAWATNSSSNYGWDNANATARKYLNETFYTGSTIDARIKSYIANVYWWKGDHTGDYANPPTSEKKTKTTSQYYVGLMYASDYYNSWAYASNTNSWLYITHGLSSSLSTYGSTYEWTMTRYGINSGLYSEPYLAWAVFVDGRLDWDTSMEDGYAVRPVFYLTSNIELSGKGTEDNPFTIVPEQPKPALDKLKETGGEVFAGGDHTTAVEGLYRYFGTYEEVTNNYICLGDEDPNTCKENSDNMYRIIGVTDGSESDETNSLGLEAGMLKVIKATPSGTSIKWASNYNYNFTWDYETSTETNGATARWYLNNTFYNGSTIDVRIKPYIANVYWWKGDRNDATTSGVETKTKTTGQYRVGLMYAGDYYNSWTYKTNKKSWLHITHGLSSSSTYSSNNEWTMSRYGIYNWNYTAWSVTSNGILSYDMVPLGYAVRPVFYLKSDVKLLGSGTENNPFTIYDNPKQPLEALQSTTSEEYLKTVVDNDELLRYVGTYEDVNSKKLNNFICFGTDDKDKCTSEPETYMYRIIGITTDNVNNELGLEKDQLKIIKATPVKESSSVKTIAWATTASSDIDWDNGSNTVRPYLNNTFLETIDETWKGIISNPKWYKGDDTSATTTTGITNEKKKQTTGNYQVGLMYASDYYNSWIYTSIPNSWLHITHGTSSSSTYSDIYEWTMTRYDGSVYEAWSVLSYDILYACFVGTPNAVRPVFYLTPDITLTGSGTESNPFIISF